MANKMERERVQLAKVWFHNYLH